MTCIVGIEHKGRIWMGGDSGVFSGWDFTSLPDGKVFAIGEFLIGVAGDARLGQLVRHKFAPPVFAEGEDLDKYMITSFVDALRDCLKNAGAVSRINEKEQSIGQLLVGIRGRLYCVWSDYAVERDSRPYRAIGCGANYALGALFVDKSRAPHTRIRNALNAAIEYSAGVKGPITILHSYPEKHDLLTILQTSANIDT